MEDVKYELLNPLPDWCYVESEWVEFKMIADKIDSEGYWIAIQAEPVNEIEEFISHILDI